MADTNSRFGVARTRTRRAIGVIMAPPMPWKKRASTKAASEPEIAQHIEPATNTAIAERKTSLAPNRSAIHELIGMKIARETR